MEDNICRSSIDNHILITLPLIDLHLASSHTVWFTSSPSTSFELPRYSIIIAFFSFPESAGLGMRLSFIEINATHYIYTIILKTGSLFEPFVTDYFMCFTCINSFNSQNQPDYDYLHFTDKTEVTSLS